MMPEPSPAEPSTYRFANAHLFPVERRLLVGDEVAAIGARAFDVLVALIERRDRLVTRAELLDVCWPDQDVEPNNIAVQIGTLRRVIGRDVIASVPGRGYRFSAQVQVVPMAHAQGAATVEPVEHRTNLPVLQPLTGRDDELAALSALIDAHRVVTVLGAGGIGKSRLAQQVLDARRDAYRHGVCWIELGSISDAGLLPGVIATALGINPSGGGSAAALQTAMAPLDILIALDNAEHLLEDIGTLVDALARAAPDVRVLLTSQAPLRLPQEQLFRLGPLAMPTGDVGVEDALRYGAVELFVQRARAADSTFSLNAQNMPAVVRLCEQLDGLPLAIEFAAARIPILGVEQIAESMHQRLQVLTGGFRTAPARQQTMAAALDWSHRLLTANERIVFRRLAVVVGSASFELVQAIAADVDHVTPDAQGPLDARAVIDALGSLVDRSLVAVVVSRGPREQRRYRLLEMPRAYAAEQLAASGEAGMMAERHARAVAALLSQAWVDRWSGSVGLRAWIQRVEADRQNGRAAYLWARRHEALDLVLAMAPVLLNRFVPSAGYEERADIAGLLDRWLPTQPAHANQLPARMMLMRFWTERDLPRSLEEAVRLRSVAEQCGDRFATYYAWAWQVRGLVQTGQLDAAATALAQVDALEDPDWPAMRLWMGAEARSIFHLMTGPPQAHFECVRRELAIVRQAGDSGIVSASNLVDALLLAGKLDEAAALASDLVDQLADSRDEFGLLVGRINLSATLLVMSELDRARPVLRAAWRTARHFALHGDCADHMALLAALEGRWPAAAAIAAYADAVYASRGAKRWPNEVSAHDRAVASARAAMAAPEFERAMADGGRLAEFEVTALAFPGG